MPRNGLPPICRHRLALPYGADMELSTKEADFLQQHHSAAMVTIGEGGLPKVARVGVALVEGKLWSSGTRDRARTKRLRRDPRCTLFVFDPKFAWLALETTVAILDGLEAPAHNLRLFRVMQEDAFLRAMTDEARLIYEFEVHRSYGLL